MANKDLNQFSANTLENFIRSKYTKKAFMITLIGLDGSGKSTQLKNIHELLINNGYTVYVPINESLLPYKTLFEKIALDSGYKNRVELLGIEIDQILISLLKWNSMIKIRDVLDKENTFILMDRYIYCFLASAECRGVKNKELIYKMFDCFPKPDLTLFLDVPPDEAIKRIQKRGTDDMELSFLEKHYSAYKSLPESKDFTFINGMQSIEEVKTEIYKHINEKFPFITT